MSHHPATSEVVLLGTGAADGWPNPFCRCATCEHARAEGVVRAPSAALVDEVLLLDCGPEAARAATRAGRSLDRLRTVLITHEHPDHCDPAFLLWRSWVGRREPLLVVGPPAVVERCRHWIGPDDPVELHAVAPGDRLDPSERPQLAGCTVRVLAANHVPGAVLYDVTTAAGARLLYATDTGALPDETVAACRAARFDLVLLEQTFGDRGDLGSGHHDLPEFARSVDRLRQVDAVTARTTVLATHLGHHNPPEPVLADRLATIDARTARDLEVLTLAPGAGAATAPGRAQPTRRVLVTGGARSGKSAAAELLVARGANQHGPVRYVATAPRYADDPEWDARIEAHQVRRPAQWSTHELASAGELAELLRGAADEDVLLVDCLTLWLTRLVDEHDAWADPGGDAAVVGAVDALVLAWSATAARVVAVTNEVGSGVVPATAAGRALRDLLGRLNARFAAAADEVRLVVAGRTLVLPAEAPELAEPARPLEPVRPTTTTAPTTPTGGTSA